MDHAVPFQCSINGWLAVASRAVPTAVQSTEERHETALRKALDAPTPAALRTIDQVTPFHRSTSGSCAWPS